MSTSIVKLIAYVMTEMPPRRGLGMNRELHSTVIRDFAVVALVVMVVRLVSVSKGVVLAKDSRPLPSAAKREVDFAKDIRPLFRESCYKCHGASRKESGLRLDRRDDALNGGDGGPAFVAGNSSESLLIKYVAGIDPDVVMPPEGDKLTDEQIGLLRAWIDQGAKWPEGQ